MTSPDHQTVAPVLRSGVSLRRAVKIALAADTVSILTMEVMDNAVVHEFHH